MQTKIDLLEEELQKLEVKYISMILEYRKEKRLIFEKYKEIEKQQIIDAYKKGEDNIDNDKSSEQYYNETYGSKGSGNTPKCTCNVDPFLCQIHGTSDGKTITAF